MTTCPKCGKANLGKIEICPYCGGMLSDEGGNRSEDNIGDVPLVSEYDQNAWPPPTRNIVPVVDPSPHKLFSGSELGDVVIGIFLVLPLTAFYGVGLIVGAVMLLSLRQYKCLHMGVKAAFAFIGILVIISFVTSMGCVPSHP